MQRSYTFAGRMALSNGIAAPGDVGEILLANIPGAVSVDRATDAEDKSGTDWWVRCIDIDRRLSVDIKVRDEDWAQKGHDDLALETWSVVDSSPGWTRDPRKRTDYVMWYWRDTRRWCLVPFTMLCAVFSEHWQSWSAKFRTATQTSRGAFGEWESECVFVPRKLVWRTIYERFGGSMSSTGANA